ncbi:HlyD family type I secretion periplasmic adaptor subunit [Sedimentitalea sp.]|uniref:HlyD family type I secretion periplasmic adaptor subunit n=1 Tax=Sedimentitalea sp. TaxID=2048915 RepID=UPI0032974564
MASREKAGGAQSSTWSAGLPITVGIVAMILLVGGLGLWSVQTNLASAVVSSGTVQVESKSQVVQHPEGGVVSEILVRDGDVVQPGDVLIRLEGVRQRSELTVVEGQLREIAVRQARISAERINSDIVTFGDDLLKVARSDPKVQRQIDDEHALFMARREALKQRTELLHEQNAQIENRIAGIEAQLDALAEQTTIVDEQLEGKLQLLSQKLIQSSPVLDLQRERSSIQGQIGRLEAEIAELRGQAASNAISLLQLQTNRQEEAVTSLRDLQFSEIELTERALRLQDILSRLEVRAPIEGIVYNSQVSALQSVVQPAQEIMYIVPQNEPLIVAARVNSIDIDEVSVGQDVSLRFSAFDQRNRPPTGGRVTNISADVVTDEVTGLPYYGVEIEPEDGELTALSDEILLPGMPVEAFIKTGDQTAFSYLVEPLKMFFSRAFRE